MVKGILKTCLGLGLVLGLAGAAGAAGIYTPGFPVPGMCFAPQAGASNVPVTPCTAVPIYPGLTGNEAIPADTNLKNGANPATVAVPSAALVYLAANSLQAQVTTGTAVTMSQYQLMALLSSTGTPAPVNKVITITGMTVALPPSPVDGQVADVYLAPLWGGNTVVATGVVVSAPGGATVTQLTPANLAGGQAWSFIYSAATTSWQQTQ